MSEPLTHTAHRWVAQSLEAGELAIDATAGNGQDTAFLARQVGACGMVLAIDCQQSAISRTQERLDTQELRPRVVLVTGDHADLLTLTPQHWHGRVGAVMFNLGYLPGGDRARVTLPATTCRGLTAASALLRPGGVLSVLAYRGHQGGPDEAAAVEDWMARAQRYGAVEWSVHHSGNPSGPVLHCLRVTESTPTATTLMTTIQEESRWPS